MFRKIKFKITSFYFMESIFAIFLMGFILYNSFFNIEINQTLKSTKVAIGKSGNYIELYVDKLKVISNILAKDNETIDYLKETEDEGRKKSLISQINNTIDSDSSIKSIIIVGKDGRLVSNEKDLNISMSKDMMKEKWYIDAIYGDSMPILTKARMQNFSMDKDNLVISISQEIIDEKGENLGVLLIDVKYKIIDNFLKDLNIGDKDFVFILNENKEVVYHKDTNYFTDISLQNKLLQISNMKGYDSKNKALIEPYKIKDTDWTLYGVSSLGEIEVIKRNLIETIIFIGGVLLLLIAYSGSFLAGKITSPIEKLEEAMRNIEEGLAYVEIDSKGCYEAESLGNHFNYMVQKIKLLLEEISEKEKYLRTSELNILHSQINPHFLYNTLDTIVWMAEFNNTEKVISMTKALGDFFRLSLSGGSEITNIDKEFDHIRKYLFIQKERYGDKLSYKIDYDENIGTIKVLKIILQPIVENAIYHGIRQGDKNGEIYISAKKDNEDIIFQVVDNGIGFDIKKLEEDKKGNNIRLGEVGIKNVDKRIKLYYGEEYGIKIESTIGAGTVVNIRVGKVQE